MQLCTPKILKFPNPHYLVSERNNKNALFTEIFTVLLFEMEFLCFCFVLISPLNYTHFKTKSNQKKCSLFSFESFNKSNSGNEPKFIIYFIVNMITRSHHHILLNEAKLTHRQQQNMQTEFSTCISYAVIYTWCMVFIWSRVRWKR